MRWKICWSCRLTTLSVWVICKHWLLDKLDENKDTWQAWRNTQLSHTASLSHGTWGIIPRFFTNQHPSFWREEVYYLLASGSPATICSYIVCMQISNLRDKLLSWKYYSVTRRPLGWVMAVVLAIKNRAIQHKIFVCKAFTGYLSSG